MPRVSGAGAHASRVVGALAAAFLIVASGSMAAVAAPKPGGGPRPLAVSVPPDPTVITPGGSATILMRVVNPGTAPVSVTVSGRALIFGDNGRVTMGTRPDPQWQGLVDFPAGVLTIPPQGFLDTPLTVRLPLRISPDLYFVGFLVTPVTTGLGNVKLVNQIGSFVTVDVPGPRVRKLIATLDTSGLVIGTETRGTLQIGNVGHAAAQYWGENDTSSSPGGGPPHQHRIDKSFLPVGHSRVIAVSGKPSWPVGFVTMRIQIIYPGRTEAATKEIVITKRVLVISPIVIVALVVVIGLGVAWLVHRRRRRRRATANRVPRPGGGSPPSATARHPRGSQTPAHPERRRRIRRLLTPRRHQPVHSR